MDGHDYAIDYQIITPRDWQDAIYSQSASQLPGLLLSMHKMVLALREEAKRHDFPTEWADRHPILCLYAYQVSFLTGNENFSNGMHEKWDSWNKLAEYYVELAQIQQ